MNVENVIKILTVVSSVLIAGAEILKQATEYRKVVNSTKTAKEDTKQK